ncbi:hypothetical protein ACFVAD_20370 [Sutcliffiella sp. NPDC057660]|uniref:hypothetical protein n=1 Tax=Sutcliffiella sp. NPDC057660 TaxID=3346199 RepID=UPI0036890BAE
MIIKKYTSLDEYKQMNVEFFSQPIVKGFFESDSSHMELLEKAIIQGDKKSQRMLDNLFFEHFLLYRLVKYITTLSHFYSIDFDKRLRKQKVRYPAILDKTIDDSENDGTMGDFLSYKQEEFHEMNQDLNLFDIIENDNLLLAFKSLTLKEMQILQLIIIENRKQVDIAHLFGETPQNIAKTKKRAIEKVQRQLINF